MVGNSKFVEMHWDASDFNDLHWYFILGTGLILRSIKLFIYKQTILTCVKVNASAVKK